MSSNDIESSPGTESTVKSRRPLDLLLVEDHEDTALAISTLLKAQGHSVTCVNAVAPALEAILHNKFDVVICDIGLPDGNGVSLISGIRAFSSVPAIAVTGYNQKDDERRCLGAGFDRHLGKPIVADDLSDALSALT